jgi:hypothetical protein
MNLELQQRAVEYNLVIRKYENLRDGLFEQMPPLELRPNINLPNGMDDDENGEQQEDGNEQSLLGEMNGANEKNDASTNEALVKQKQKEEATKTLLDLFDDDLGGISTAPPTTTNNKINNDLFDLMSTNDNDSTPASINSKIDAIKQLSNKQSQPSASSNNLDSIFNLGNSSTVKIAPKENSSTDLFDLLGGSSNLDNSKTKANSNNGNSGLDDLFGGLGVSTSTNLANNSLKPKQTNDIMDLFNTGSTINNNNINSNNGFDSLSSSNSSMVVYEKNDIKIILEPTASGKHSTDEQHFIQMTAQNNGLMSMVKEFLFSAAVPKTMQMQLSTPLTSVIQPMDSLVQTMAISNPKKVLFVLSFSHVAN